MKIIELKGKEILRAYDGDQLSEDFGYSCANFNVYDFYGKKSNQDNDLEMFDIYIENYRNISCFVAINEDTNKIIGRRMFFKGNSMLNDRYYNVPVEMGKTICYMYGYYGERDRNAYYNISQLIINRYKKYIIHTDSIVLRDGIKDNNIQNFFILQIEKMNFDKYPPTDFLYVCPDIRSFSNFKPNKEVLKVIERDNNKKGLKFEQAYRYNPNKIIDTNYKTWGDKWDF